MSKKIDGKYPGEITNSYLSGYTERVTGGVKAITTDHANVHEKEAFSAFYFTSAFASAAQSTITFITPATSYVHFKVTEFWTNQAEVWSEFFSGVATSGGTTVACNARNHTTPVRASSTVIKGAATATTVSDPFEMFVYGGGGTNTAAKTGGDRSLDIEFVLAPATTYAIVTTNKSGTTADQFTWFFWYEEAAG